MQIIENSSIKKQVAMKDLSQVFDTMHASFKAKMQESGKQKEIVGRSLNDWNLIKSAVLKEVHRKFGVGPADVRLLQPSGFAVPVFFVTLNNEAIQIWLSDVFYNRRR